MDTMGDRLRLSREARGLTTRELAARLGVQQPWVSKVENNHMKSIHTDRLRQWCRVLGVSADWVLDLWRDWTPDCGIQGRQASLVNFDPQSLALEGPTDAASGGDGREC